MEILFSIGVGGLLLVVGFRLAGEGALLQLRAAFKQSVIRRPDAAPMAALGFVAGALLLDVRRLVTVMTSLVEIGVAKPRQAAPAIAWAHTGTATLVLAATLDLRFLAPLLLLALGMVFLFELDRSARRRHRLAALLGASLLFLGLALLKQGVADLTQLPALQATAEQAGRGGLLALGLVALVMGLVARAPALVALVIVALAPGAAISLPIAVATTIGAGIGAALVNAVAARQLRGTPRQLAELSVATDAAGAMLFAGLALILTASARTVPIAALLDVLPLQPAASVACSYLAAQGLGAIFVAGLATPIMRVLARAYPPPPEEHLLAPRYLFEATPGDAEGGAQLVQKEQVRVLGLLRQSLDAVRDDVDANANGAASAAGLYRVASAVGQEIDARIVDLLAEAPRRAVMDRLTTLRAAQAVLDRLGEEIHTLVAGLEKAPPSPRLAPMVDNLIESLHLVLTMLGDEVEAPDEFQHTSLVAMTADRSNNANRLRHLIAIGEGPASALETETVAVVSSGFEHAMGLVQRFLALVSESN